MRSATQEILINMAMQAGEQAIMETAAGLAMLARGLGMEGTDPGADASAASHFASAGMYAAIATTTGVIGGAMARSNQPVSAGGGSGRLPASAASVPANDNAHGGMTLVFNQTGIFDGKGARGLVADTLTDMSRNNALPPVMRMRVGAGR